MYDLPGETAKHLYGEPRFEAMNARAQVLYMAQAMDEEALNLPPFRPAPGMPMPGFRRFFLQPDRCDTFDRAWLAHDLFLWRVTGTWSGIGPNPCA